MASHAFLELSILNLFFFIFIFSIHHNYLVQNGQMGMQSADLAQQVCYNHWPLGICFNAFKRKHYPGESFLAHTAALMTKESA